MLNRRFMTYIVVFCVVGLLLVGYIGYKEYQKQVAFERFTSDGQTLNHSVEHTETDTHPHLTDTLPHGGGNPDLNTEGNTANPYFIGKQGDEYVYKVGVGDYGYIYTPEPFDQEDIEMQAWEITGEKTPYVEKRLKELAENSPYKGQVVQRIVTSDGQLHDVIVPHDRQYEEGDAILRSELDPPILEAFDKEQRVEVEGEPIPDEYYAIEDPYERHEFIEKVFLSKELKISVAEIEAKVARGEIDVSLSATQKENVDNKLAMEERGHILNSFAKPRSSDKPPVKVQLLSDTAEDAVPGWMRKMEGSRPSGSGEAAADGVYSGTDTVSEGRINEDGSGAPVRSDVPLSPSDLPGMVKPPSSQTVADLENQLTPQGIEAELTEGLSTNPADKAQQLIDQYGTEEGLRRLRESDPDAARRFEQRLRGEPSRSSPSSDGGGSPDSAP